MSERVVKIKLLDKIPAHEQAFEKSSILIQQSSV